MISLIKTSKAKSGIRILLTRHSFADGHYLYRIDIFNEGKKKLICRYNKYRYSSAYDEYSINCMKYKTKRNPENY